ALMVIEVDQNINDTVLTEIQSLPNITQVARVVD
ncbi:MAG: L-serine ammonia-lyase, iron-sulfur-dependent, subunit beta, partial [Bacillus sp. (in: Bacteria)]|nr:L-serine ammonia-lyase, iron-sulfur-dependent, subunit beta [Bacillus sp. (in: firmicutes)]